MLSPTSRPVGRYSLSISLFVLLLSSLHAPASSETEWLPGADGSATALSHLLATLQYTIASNPLNMSDPIEASLAKILEYDGPDMRPSRDFRDNPFVDLPIAIRAWKQLKKLAQSSFPRRVQAMRPFIGKLLLEARASPDCYSSAMKTLSGAERLESWAIKLVNSWGSFPASGLFEGTYGDIGSYATCVNIKNTEEIQHAHYCSLTFKPLLPKRKDYELVLTQEKPALRKLFDVPTRNGTNSTSDGASYHNFLADLLEHAHYNHFVYYKLGTCWPIGCSPVDVKRVTKLLGRANMLENGPVKCYSHHEDDYEQIYIQKPTSDNKTEPHKLIVSLDDDNAGIYIWKPHFHQTHKIALTILVAVSVFIILMSLVDLVVNRLPELAFWTKCAMIGVTNEEFDRMFSAVSGDEDDPRLGVSVDSSRMVELKSGNSNNIVAKTNNSGCKSNNLLRMPPVKSCKRKTGIMGIVEDCSIVTNAMHFFQISEGQLKNDILCLNGLRCVTMTWILLNHTMLYNDWSAWGRTRMIEVSLRSPMNQPLFNGSYLVDTFFLMSGLLSAFTAFRHSQGVAKRFSSVSFILGRWLRLTPQILLCSLIYMVLPAVSSGPHWWPIVGEFSQNCINNWWINALHLQAFYKSDHMCNFVTWWISVDYFYHFIAVAIIWLTLLAGHRTGFMAIVALVAPQVAWQAFRHYQQSLPPNLFSTIPQTGAMWTSMTMGFYWKPYTHAVSFFSGFYIGYLMALKRDLIIAWLDTRKAVIGWTLSAVLLLAQSFGSFWWIIGDAEYSRESSTIFDVVCPLIWSGVLCWIIIACHHGYGYLVNKFLSARVFIVLGKASYLVYLSHFQIFFLFFGNQHLLLEPTPLMMMYIIIGNIVLSTALGVTLCIVYELPWLKQQRKLMRFI